MCVCVIGLTVCTVGIIYVYVDTVFLGCFFVNCLVGYLRIIVWTPVVLGVLYAFVLYFLYLHLFSAVEHDSHRQAL